MNKPFPKKPVSPSILGQSPPQVAILGLVLLLTGNVHAATNTPVSVKTTATNLSTAASYNQTPAANPNDTDDIEFSNSTYSSPASFTVGGSLQYGSLNDLNTSQTITVTGTEINLLNLNGNGVSGNSTDLLYVASGATLDLVSHSGAVVNVGISGTIDAVGTLNISNNDGTSAGLSITTGKTATFIGSGTTTLSASIINGSTTTVQVGSATSNMGGTLVITGKGTTGGATVNTGGSLLYGSASAAATLTGTGSAGSITLNGGIFGLNGTAGATNANVGTLTLTDSTTSSLNLVAGGNSVKLSLTTLSGTGDLVISGWNGSATSGSLTTDIAYTGSSTTLSDISWASGTVVDGITYQSITGAEDVNGQIVPDMADAIPAAPEPSTVFAALGLAGLLTWSNRRQLLKASRLRLSWVK